MRVSWAIRMTPEGGDFGLVGRSKVLPRTLIRYATIIRLPRYQWM